MKDVFCLNIADKYKGACIGNLMLFILLEILSFLLVFNLRMNDVLFLSGFVPVASFCWNLRKYVMILKSRRNYETINISSSGIIISNSGLYKSLSWRRVKKVSFMVDRSCRFGNLVIAFFTAIPR